MESSPGETKPTAAEPACGVIEVTLRKKLNRSVLLTEGGLAGAGESEPSTSNARPPPSQRDSLHPIASDSCQTNIEIWRLGT